MISIATGGNILQPGPRTWLAGCPWVSVNAWSPESTTPQAPVRDTFTAKGAFWRAAKCRDLGNAQTAWSFTSQVQLASFQASAAFVAGLTDAGTWQGILEWWVPDGHLAGTYKVYRAAGCTVQCAVLEVAGVGITVGYRATFGLLACCGSETVSPDVLSDGGGLPLGRLASDITTGDHDIIGIRTYDATPGASQGGIVLPPPEEDEGGGGSPPTPGLDILGTGGGHGGEVGTGSGTDVLGTGF